MDTKIDPQSAFAITLANLLKNIHRFVSVEQPFSKKADEKGTDMGQFLVDNAVLAIKVEEKRVKLMEHLKPHVDVEVTYFSNWAGTATECVGLMLIVKPKTVHDVCNIVKGAIKYNLKVSYYVLPVQFHLTQHDPPTRLVVGALIIAGPLSFLTRALRSKWESSLIFAIFNLNQTNESCSIMV